MEINATTKIDDLLKEYPFLEDFLVTLSPKFKGLKNPIMRKTIGKVATLSKVAGIGGLELDDFLTALTDRRCYQRSGGKAGGAQGNYQGPSRRGRHDGSQTKIQSVDQRR
jgi:hypothetical protein